jgi:hypothetical protein
VQLKADLIGWFVPQVLQFDWLMLGRSYLIGWFVKQVLQFDWIMWGESIRLVGLCNKC